MLNVLVPISLGDLIDRVTILEIKQERIIDPDKNSNVCKQLSALNEIMVGLTDQAPVGVHHLIDRLRAVNTSLWNIEDDIRKCERQKDFGQKFIELARAVYFMNENRAIIKRQLDVALGSRFVEEKSYASYA